MCLAKAVLAHGAAGMNECIMWSFAHKRYGAEPQSEAVRQGWFSEFFCVWGVQLRLV